MARTGGLHFVGAFLLLVAAVLLLIPTISAPVINNLAILRVDLNGAGYDGPTQGASGITFGTFGYCVLGGSGGDFCTQRHIGYRPSEVVGANDGTRFNVANGLTGAMVLHPVACAIAFVAFLVALGAGMIGSLLAFVIAAVAWVLTLVVMAIDFTLFAIIRNAVNDDDDSPAQARYDSGMWCVLAAFILMFLGACVVLFTCCSARIRKRRDRRAGNRVGAGHEPKTDYGAPAAGRRGGRWGRWRRR